MQTQTMQSRMAERRTTPYTQRYFTMKFAEVGYHKHYTNEVIPHVFDHMLFAMMVKGKKTINIAGGTTPVELQEGSSLFNSSPIRATSFCADITSDTRNGAPSDASSAVCVTVEIEREKIQEIMYRVTERNELALITGKPVNMAPFSVSSGGTSSHINDTIKSIFQISRDGATFKDRLIELKLEELILYTLQSDLRTALIGNLQAYSSSVSLAYVIEYINNNLHRHLSVETLAEKAHLSIPSFYRHFKSAFGFTPNDYINQKRMQEAKYLLEHSKLSIADISDKLGFSTQQHFAKMFRSVWGTCPSAVRPKKGLRKYEV
jgi:AraC-like DNA-binding protein